MANPIVTIQMKDGGVMKAELYPDIAPESVKNFVGQIHPSLIPNTARVSLRLSSGWKLTANS